MIIGQVAPAALATGTKGALTASGGAKGFGDLLVQTVAGSQGEGAQGEGAAAAVAVAVLPQNAALAGLLSGDLAALFAGDNTEGIQTQLAELINALQQGGDKADEGEVEDEDALGALLDQFNELIASMLGMPVVAINAKPAASTEGETKPETEAASSMAAVKKDLQTVLVQLQTLVNQGADKNLTKDQLAAFSQQLDTLRQELDGKRQEKTLTTPLQANRQLSEYDGQNVPQQTTQAAAIVHLNRLSYQGGNVRLFAPVTAEAVTEAANVETAAAASEPQTVQQLWMSAPGTAADSQKPAADIKMAQQAVPVQQFSSTMAGMIVKQFGITKADGFTEARISLLPEHLGQVDVRISIQNGQLNAHFVADSAAAKDMLENQISQLRSSLQAQGLQVDKLEVTQNSIQGQMFHEQSRQGAGGQQQPKQSKAKDDNMISELRGFENELVEQAAAGDLGYGRAINITA